MLDLKRRFWLREVRYDPYQMSPSRNDSPPPGLPMVEFAQSVPNLTEASTNLYELLKGRNLTVYSDDDLRLAISRCVALETSRGWRIAKEKASHKIDAIVALAQAALGAVQQGQVASGVDLDFQQRAQAIFREQSRVRSEHADAAPGSHASGGGFDWARAEDAAAAAARSSPRWKWRSY